MMHCPLQMTNDVLTSLEIVVVFWLILPFCKPKRKTSKIVDILTTDMNESSNNNLTAEHRSVS